MTRALLAAASLMATLAVGPSHVAAATAQSGTSSWRQYFYPARVGYTCQEALESPTGALSGSSTLEVSGVTSQKKGLAVVVTQTNMAKGSSSATRESLHYLLSTNGTLVSSQSQGVAGVAENATVMGTTVIPSVPKLLAHKTTESRFTELVDLTSSEVKSLNGSLIGSQDVLRIVVTERETGLGLQSVTVPLGTYTGALVVRSSVASVKVTNLQPEAARGFVSRLLPTFRAALNLTTWYAPGVGAVEIKLAAIRGVLTSCTG